ncbi:hypothetical protein QYZ87_05710 [Porphyromonadaceae bacterium W3.11]|nr:hypothetical protein [Porphyromonadaceae bacterium W3.11]
MKKRTKNIILAIILMLCIAVPVIGIFFDFGGGTDDAASGVVQSITGQEQVLDVPQIGYEPSEATEPWLFVLQIAIGIGIFVIAYIALNKLEEKNA